MGIAGPSFSNKEILIELNNLEIGLDVSQIKIEDEDTEEKNLKDPKDIIYESIISGIRLIVCEPSNEIIVGEAIERALNEKKVERKDLFIVTKLEIEEKEDPEKALNDSLKRLKLTYVDLYLDHWPSCKNYNEPNKYKLIPIRETWQKMETLVDIRLTRSIGVSNYNIVNLLNILSICKIKPVVNEVEFHPYLFQKDLKQFCDLEKIKIFAYNPLSKGEYNNKKLNLQNKYEGYLEAPLNYLGDIYKQKRTTILINYHMALHIIPILGIKIKGKSNLFLEKNKRDNTFLIPKINIDQKYIEILCSFTENQFRLNDGSDIFGINIFA